MRTSIVLIVEVVMRCGLSQMNASLVVVLGSALLLVVAMIIALAQDIKELLK